LEARSLVAHTAPAWVSRQQPGCRMSREDNPAFPFSALQPGMGATTRERFSLYPLRLKLKVKPNEVAKTRQAPALPALPTKDRAQKREIFVREVIGSLSFSPYIAALLPLDQFLPHLHVSARQHVVHPQQVVQQQVRVVELVPLDHAARHHLVPDRTQGECSSSSSSSSSDVSERAARGEKREGWRKNRVQQHSTAQTPRSRSGYLDACIPIITVCHWSLVVLCFRFAVVYCTARIGVHTPAKRTYNGNPGRNQCGSNLSRDSQVGTTKQGRRQQDTETSRGRTLQVLA